MSDFLDVRATLPGPSGTLALHLPPYDLEKAFGERISVSWRRVEHSNRWMEGSYLVQAVKENVSETINVWVETATVTELDTAVTELLNNLEQLRFSLTVSNWEGGVEKVRKTYACQAANYELVTTSEYSHSTVALVKATVPRLPHVTTVHL